MLVLPTLSDNFGLVVAEALERGKRVITTDGAPAWGENLSRVERLERVEEARGDGRVERVETCSHLRQGFGGRGGGDGKSGGVVCGGVGELSRVERVERVDGEMWSGYGGRLIYLKGYREGTKEQRVELLRRAIELMSVG